MTQLSLLPEKLHEPSRRDLLLGALPANEDLPGPDPTPGMVASVKSFGIQHAIAVEEVRAGEKVIAYKVIHGRRRIKAARAAKRDSIPALIYQCGMVNRHALALVENEHRAPNPVSECETILALRDAGHKDEEIMTQLSLNANTFKSRTRMIDGLNADLLNAYLAGDFGTNVSRRIASLTKPQQDGLKQLLQERKADEEWKGKNFLTAEDVDLAARVGDARGTASLPDDLFEVKRSEELPPAVLDGTLRLVFTCTGLPHEIALALEELVGRIHGGQLPLHTVNAITFTDAAGHELERPIRFECVAEPAEEEEEEDGE